MQSGSRATSAAQRTKSRVLEAGRRRQPTEEGGTTRFLKTQLDWVGCDKIEEQH